MADDATTLVLSADVMRDIRKLAEKTGQAEADAVAEAVRERLELADRERKIAEAAAAFRALPHKGQILTDDDLYDEHGLPR